MEAGLGDVLRRAWRRLFVPVRTDYAFDSWGERYGDNLASQVAGEQVELAVMQDTAANEW